MTFNTQFINEDGWNRILKDDNIDYDWTKVKTKEEALVVILAHEAQHAMTLLNKLMVMLR